MSNLVPRAQRRQDFAERMDTRELAHVLDTSEQSVLGMSHGLCEHNRTASNCPLCIYGEAGNRVIADAGAMEFAERVQHRQEMGEKVDAVETAEQAYRSGFASGVSAQREAPIALAVAGSREGKTGDDVAMGILIALKNGQISKVEALDGMQRWAADITKQLTTEADPHNRRAALTGDRG